MSGSLFFANPQTPPYTKAELRADLYLGNINNPTT